MISYLIHAAVIQNTKQLPASVIPFKKLHQRCGFQQQNTSSLGLPVAKPRTYCLAFM